MKLMPWTVLAMFSVGATENPILIGMPSSNEKQLQHIQHKVAEAYRKMGFTPTFVTVPSQRRLTLLTDGMLDAELFRICNLDAEKYGAIVVPVTLDSMQLSAYALTSEKLVNWQQNRELFVSHTRGFKLAENLELAGKRVLVTEPGKSFELMLDGRVDIAVEASLTIDLLKTLTPANRQIYEQEIASVGLCHILSQQRQDLLPALTEILQQEK